MHELEHNEDVGTVTDIQGEKVKVALIRGSGCKSCSLNGFCFSKNTAAEFILDTQIPLQVGDRVQLEISAASRILSSLLIFLLPVLLLFGGYGIGTIFWGELLAILTGFIFFALSFFIISMVDKRFGKKLLVRIVAKVNSREEE